MSLDITKAKFDFYDFGKKLILPVDWPYFFLSEGGELRKKRDFITAKKLFSL